MDVRCSACGRRLRATAVEPESLHALRCPACGAQLRGAAVVIPDSFLLRQPSPGHQVPDHTDLFAAERTAPPPALSAASARTRGPGASSAQRVADPEPTPPPWPAATAARPGTRPVPVGSEAARPDAGILVAVTAGGRSGPAAVASSPPHADSQSRSRPAEPAVPLAAALGQRAPAPTVHSRRSEAESPAAAFTAGPTIPLAVTTARRAHTPTAAVPSPPEGASRQARRPSPLAGALAGGAFGLMLGFLYVFVVPGIDWQAASLPEALGGLDRSSALVLGGLLSAGFVVGWLLRLLARRRM